MENLKKAAGILDRFAKMLICLCWAVGIIALAVTVTYLLVRPDKSLLSAALHLGNIKIVLASGALPEKELFYFPVSLLIVLCRAVFWVAVLRTIRRILKPMAAGLPFTVTVSQNLKKLSYIFLLGGGLVSFFNMLGDLLLYRAYQLDQIFLSEQITGCTVDARFDCSFLLGFALLYLLSFIFQYGEELQRQSDETL